MTEQRWDGGFCEIPVGARVTVQMAAGTRCDGTVVGNGTGENGFGEWTEVAMDHLDPADSGYPVPPQQSDCGGAMTTLREQVRAGRPFFLYGDAATPRDTDEAPPPCPCGARDCSCGEDMEPWEICDACHQPTPEEEMHAVRNTSAGPGYFCDACLEAK